MSQPIKDRLSVKQKQWLWFAALWCFGFGSLLLISMIIRMIMNIA